MGCVSGRKRIGGAPANFAYHMLQFGFDSRVVSAVGEDVLGNEILENLSEAQSHLIGCFRVGGDRFPDHGIGKSDDNGGYQDAHRDGNKARHHTQGQIFPILLLEHL